MSSKLKKESFYFKIRLRVNKIVTLYNLMSNT